MIPSTTLKVCLPAGFANPKSINPQRRFEETTDAHCDPSHERYSSLVHMGKKVDDVCSSIVTSVFDQMLALIMPVIDVVIERLDKANVALASLLEGRDCDDVVLDLIPVDVATALLDLQGNVETKAFNKATRVAELVFNVEEELKSLRIFVQSKTWGL